MSVNEPGYAPLIITKVLMPRWRPGLLPRPRLVQFLRHNLHRKLIVVAAAAGYGKTSLLIDFARTVEVPVCWYTLDRGDRDPRVFLEYLVAAIQQRFPGFGARAQAALRDPALARQEIGRLIGVLVNEIYEALPNDFVLVLDNYEVVDEDEDLGNVLRTFIHYMPEQCHVILSSRVIPSQAAVMLPFVASGDAAGLGGNALCFSVAETQALVQQVSGRQLSTPEAEALVAACEGWVMGIQLATRGQLCGGMGPGVRGSLPAPQAPVSRPTQPDLLFDYLTREVFLQLSPPVQEFVLISSVLEHLSPGLCDELLDRTGSEAMLRRLPELLPQFVVALEGEGEWYRYHSLFHAFLQRKLSEDKGTAAFWRRRAGQVYEKQQIWSLAFENYQRAGEFDAAARMAERAGRHLFESGKWDTLRDWLNRLPREAQTPSLLLLQAKLCTETGHLAAALDWLEQGEQRCNSGHDRTTRARILVQRATVWLLQGRYLEATEACLSALSPVPEEDGVVMADAHKTLGECYRLQGLITTSVQNLERALQLFQHVGDAYNVANLQHDLGIGYEALGRLLESSQAFEQAAAYWRRSGSMGPLANTLNSLGVSQYLQGNTAEALALLNEALAKAREFGYPRIEAVTLVSLGDVYRDEGDFSRALDAYAEGLAIAKQIEVAALVVYTLDAIGNTHRLQNNLSQAKQYFEGALKLARRHQSAYEIGMVRTSLGLLALQNDDPDRALEQLTEAARLLQRGGIKREWAQAQFHLARTEWQLGRLVPAENHLLAAAEAADALGYDHFLVIAGREALPVLEWAASLKSCGAHYRRVLGRLRPAADRPQTVETATPALAPLEIIAFGKCQVRRDGHEVLPTWNQLRELFFYLLAGGPQGMRKDQILETFWPEAAPPNANQSFKAAIYRVRQHFCPVICEGQWYTVRLPPGSRYDVAEFEHLIELASKPNESAEVRADLCTQAIALYRGDFLAEYYSDWCVSERQRLEAAYLRLLAFLGNYHAARGEYEQSLGYYEQSLAQDPLQEIIQCEVMRCYAALGDRGTAIKRYLSLRELLQAELGLDPMPETEALYRQILDGLL